MTAENPYSEYDMLNDRAPRFSVWCLPISLTQGSWVAAIDGAEVTDPKMRISTSSDIEVRLTGSAEEFNSREPHLAIGGVPSLFRVRAARVLPLDLEFGYTCHRVYETRRRIVQIWHNPPGSDRDWTTCVYMKSECLQC